MMKFLMIASALLAASSALAGEVKFTGRTYVYSCGYYSSTAGEYQVELTNESLPWGTHVLVHYGLGNYRKPADGSPVQIVRSWERKQLALAQATAPFVWTAQLPEMTLNYRSSPMGYNTVEFVFEIRLPDGTSYYDRGGKGAWGYYAADVWASGVSSCVGADGKPPVREFEVSTHDRY